MNKTVYGHFFLRYGINKTFVRNIKTSTGTMKLNFLYNNIKHLIMKVNNLEIIF